MTFFSKSKWDKLTVSKHWLVINYVVLTVYTIYIFFSLNVFAVCLDGIEINMYTKKMKMNLMKSLTTTHFLLIYPESLVWRSWHTHSLNCKLIHYRYRWNENCKRQHLRIKNCFRYQGYRNLGLKHLKSIMNVDTRFHNNRCIMACETISLLSSEVDEAVFTRPRPRPRQHWRGRVVQGSWESTDKAVRKPCKCIKIISWGNTLTEHV